MKTMSQPEIVVLPDLETISRAAAGRVAALAQACDPFTVALSGGSTPRRLYELLAASPFRERIPWAQTHVFWGDERCVPPDHPDSNYHLARQALLDRVPLLARNVHRILGELEPEQAAAAYRAELLTALGDDRRFDLVLLGLGDDGHTASLFPGTAALQERTLAAAVVYVERLASWRITLTLPTLNAARHVLFLVSGANKAPALVRVLAGEPLPAGLVRPPQGQLTWLVDRAAHPPKTSGRP